MLPVGATLQQLQDSKTDETRRPLDDGADKQPSSPRHQDPVKPQRWRSPSPRLRISEQDKLRFLRALHSNPALRCSCCIHTHLTYHVQRPTTPHTHNCSSSFNKQGRIDIHRRKPQMLQYIRFMLRGKNLK